MKTGRPTTVFYAMILICICLSFTGCPPIGGGGADVDMSNYYTKTEVDGLVTWMKDGNNISNKNTGNVGIGTTTPGTSKLRINGNLDASSITIGGVPVATSSETYWSNNAGKVYYSGGNVGIGTSSPSVALEVVGDLAVSGRVSASGSNLLPTSCTAGQILKWDGVQWTCAADIDTWGNLQQVTDQGATTTRAVTFSGGASFPGSGIWNSSGSVGIGTTTPAGKLDVNGAIYQRGISLHADYVFEKSYEIESIEDHAKRMWSEKHLPALDKAMMDENGQDMIEIGSQQRGILEELEKAHVYIDQLNRENAELRERLSKVERMIGL